MACGILFPQSRMEPTPPALKVWSLNHWSAREVLKISMSHETHRNAHSLAMLYICFSCRNTMVLKLIFREKVTTHSSEQNGKKKKKTFFRKCEESLTSQILHRKHNCLQYKAETHSKAFVSKMETWPINPLSSESNSTQMTTWTVTKSIRYKDGNN